MISTQAVEPVETGDSPQLTRMQLLGLFAGIELALFISALDQTILNAALPRMSATLGGFELAPWIITSYLLSSTVITPVAGRLADKVGTKRALIWSTIVFAVSSIACGAATNMVQLIAARAVQGLGGGATIALCFISIGELFVARERGRFQGVLAAAFIVAALLGPGLGGWLADANLWPLIFYINVPLGILAAACLQLFFPPGRRHLAGVDEPLIPAHVFKSRLINISLITVFVTGIGMFGGSLVFAVLLQEIFHKTATQTGYALTPLMLVVAFASILSGWLVSRTGRYKALCIIGLIFMGAGSMLLATVNSNSPLTVVYADAAINGIGLGLLLPVQPIVVQNAVKASVLGFTTSMTQLFRSLGGTIGTGILSAILFYLLRFQSLQSALTTVFLIYGVTVAATLILNLFLPEVELKRTHQT